MSVSPATGSSSGRRELVWLLALTAAALALRALQLTRHELFVDEAATWWFARLTAAGRLAEQLALEPTPPLYYALVGGLMRLAGESDLVLRLPSLLCGAAAVPAVYALGRRLLGRRVGWIAAALLAVHPLHVFYSREARVYPLLLLLTVLLLLALWRALERDRWPAWGLYAGVLVAVCYSHFYGIFLIATAGLIVVLLAPSGRARWRGLAATALAGVAFLPYLAATLPHLQGSGAAWSIEAFYRDLPQERQLGRVLEMQLLGADYHPYLRYLDQPPTPPIVRWPSLAAQLLLLVLAFAGGLRARADAAAPDAGFAETEQRRRALAFLALAWLVPILLPWGVTHTFRAIFHSGRHDVYTLGAVTVLLAAGLAALLTPRRPQERRRRQLVAAAAVAAFALGAGFRLYWLHAVPAHNPARATGAWLAAHAGPDDRVVAVGIQRLVNEHYTRLGGSDVPFASFPRSTDEHPGWSDVMTLMEDQAALSRAAAAQVAELGRELPPGGALYLLLRRYERRGGAVSATWLVDRHLLEQLWAAGWRATTPPAAAALDVAVYHPPGAAAARGSERGHPGGYLVEAPPAEPSP